MLSWKSLTGTGVNSFFFNSACQCSAPPSIANGRFQSSSAQYNCDSSYVDYSCSYGYTLDGNSRIRCINRQWENPPTCRRTGKQWFFQLSFSQIGFLVKFRLILSKFQPKVYSRKGLLTAIVNSQSSTCMVHQSSMDDFPVSYSSVERIISTFYQYIIISVQNRGTQYELIFFGYFVWWKKSK